MENKYYELSHPVYGIWYASDIINASSIVECNTRYFCQKSKKYRSFMIKDWVITEIYDLDDIPSKWIDAPIERIKNYT